MTPETQKIDVTAYNGSVSGEIAAQASFPVTLDAQYVAEARGTLTLPIGLPLVIVAEIRDSAGAAVSRAESAALTLDESGSQTLSLILLPTAGNPSLVDIAPGSNTVSIPAGESRILRFSASRTGANVKWTMASFPDFRYQVRNTAGEKISPSTLAESTGIAFSLSGTGYHYVIVYNSGTIAASNVPFTLETMNPLLIALNTGGQAYRSVDGNTWTGPVSTGLGVGNDIAFANGLFVAVGQIGTSAGLATSPDGVTWTSQNMGGASAQFMRVAANPSGRLVTTRYYGSTLDSFTSTDSLTWTGPAATGLSGTSGVGPAWLSPNWYLANGNLSTFKKTPDGSTWTSTTGTTGMYQPYTLIGVNGRLIAGGGAPSNTNKQTVTSTDGAATFGALVNVAAAGYYVQAFAVNPNTYRVLSVGSGSSAQANYSDNYGASWTTSTGTGANTFRAACWWKSGFLIGDSAGGVYTSSDGSAFTLAGSAGTGALMGIAYNGAP